jgi:hypothetical protein
LRFYNKIVHELTSYQAKGVMDKISSYFYYLYSKLSFFSKIFRNTSRKSGKSYLNFLGTTVTTDPKFKLGKDGITTTILA